MPGQSADRNLLFGVFALQMDFLTRDQLVEGMQAWVLAKSRPLEDILVEKGLLAAADRGLLLPLVLRHVEQHGGDPEKSLKAISSVTMSVEVLKQIEDGDLQHSLASLKLREPSPVGDIPATVSFRPEFGQSATRYLSLRPHAKGGLGEVFVARDTELDREVALKEIQQHHAHDADSRSRFLMEAEITGKLEHPGIVPVYGLGSYPDGRPFYAMRFIRGDSLHHAIQEFHKNPPAGNPYESVAFRRLLGRFVDVCNAVGYAHSRGVLHRDLKPGNVMLGKHGETLVVDWGLAKIKGREESSTDGEATLQVSSGSGTDQTLPGSAIGTPGYMSPEQAEGKVSLLGPATDIYGLGATLYTLLTGKRPIEADTIHEVLRRTVKGEILKPREHDPQIPKVLEAICLNALKLNPADRYATCQALADDVERFLADESVTAHRESFFARVGRFGRKHRGVVNAVGIALILIAGISTGAALLVNQQRQRAEQLATKEEIARIRADQLATEKSELATNEAQARKEAEQNALDAKKQLAWNYFTHGLAEYDAGRMGNGIRELLQAVATCPPEDLRAKGYYKVMLNRVTRRGRALGFPMCHEGAVVAVAFSPDGERLLTGSWDNTARLWDARTGTPVGEPIVPELPIDEVEFSPDGERVLTRSADGVRLWNAKTGTPFGELMDHKGFVDEVEFSPDGELVLTTSRDEVRLWNAKTGTPLGEPMRHEGAIAEVEFNPDGERLLTTSWGEVRLWNAKTGTPLGEPMRHEGAIAEVAFSPNGERVLTTSLGEMARLWDSRTARLLGEPMRHAGINTAVFSPDGKRVLTGSEDGTARLWNARTGAAEGEPIQTEAPIHGIAFSPNGERVLTDTVTVNADSEVNGLAGLRMHGTARLWNAWTGAAVGESIPHEWTVDDMVFSPDGERLLTRSRFGMAQLWDVRTGSAMGESMRCDDAVVFSPDGERILTVVDDNAARLWNGRSGSPLGEPMRHEGRIMALAFSPDGEWVLTGSMDRTARLWDTRSGTPMGEPMHHEDQVKAVAFSPDGERVLTRSDDGTTRLWNARTKAAEGELMVHESEVVEMAFSPDWERVVTVSDNMARLWNGRTGTPLGKSIHHEDQIRAVAFSPDGEWVVIGSSDGTARLWNARTGTAVGEFLRHMAPISAVAFSPDGQRVLIGSNDATARLWNPLTWTEVGEPMQHEGAVIAVVFSPDGERILTNCWETLGKSARLWDATTRTPLGEPMRHQGSVLDMAFSPNGDQVLTGSNDATAQLWDARTGAPLHEPMRHEGAITALAFSPDGQWVLTGSEDGTARLWDNSFLNFPDKPDVVHLCLEMMTGMKLSHDPKVSPERLSQKELTTRWQTLERDAKPFLEQMRQRLIRRSLEGHRNATREAEDAGHWFAAEFHLRHLLQAEPENQDLKSRREWVMSKLEQSKTNADPMRDSPSVVEPAVAEKPR